MKSSSGQYYIGLDHVRALAVLLVWCWHFIHVHESNLAATPIFPLSLLAEGHTGVSIFMALSGYLFAKLLAGKQIDYPAFITNRFFRLVPLLAFVVLLVGIKLVATQGASLAGYLSMAAQGLVLPTLPNGGWSITVEFHFYLILPLLLFLQGRWKFALLGALLCAVTLRAFLYQHVDDMQQLSYFTIVGRIDQFLLGILAYQFRSHAQGRHLVVAAALASFAAFYWLFDSLGGFAKSTDPALSPIWIIMPAIEGLAYALAIAWYDTSFRHSSGRISRFVASIGTYSYSIYLLHFFVVFELAIYINRYLCDLSNIYVALAFALLTFPIMVPLGSVSYRMIELPFLAHRRKYIITEPSGGNMQPAT